MDDSLATSMETADGVEEDETDVSRAANDSERNSDEEWLLPVKNTVSLDPFIAISSTTHVALI